MKFKSLALLIVLFYSLLLGIKLHQDHYSLSNFILLGDKFADENVVSKKINIISNSYGYDGQFYYRLALNPFTTKATEFGITLDQPALRQQRILFPFIAWVISAGNPDLVPISLLLVNCISLMGLIYVSIKLVKHYQRPAWLAALIPLYPAFIICLDRGLTEILASSLLLAGYLLYVQKKNYLSSLLFVLAILTRETTLILPSVIALYHFWKFIKDRHSQHLKEAVIFAIPFVIYIIYQLVLRLIWGQSALSASSELNIVFPFTGWTYLFYFKTLATKLRVLEIFYLLGAVFLASINFRKITDIPLKITWLAYLLFFTMYSKWTWTEDWNFFRATTELMIFSFLIVIIKGSRREKLILLLCTIAMAALMASKVLL